MSLPLKPSRFMPGQNELSAADLNAILDMAKRHIVGDGHVQVTRVGDKIVVGLNPALRHRMMTPKIVEAG